MLTTPLISACPSGQASCSNCGKCLSCGCQRRIATDGVRVCVSCVEVYESTLDQAEKSSLISVNPHPAR